MKKKLISLALACACSLVLAACSTSSSLSYTYEVDTGDRIKVKLDTSEGLSMSASSPISFTKDGEQVASASFMVGDVYDLYRDLVDEDPTATLLEESERDDCSYFFYTVDGDEYIEYNYIILVAGSETSLALGSIVSQETSTNVFNSLSFSLE